MGFDGYCKEIIFYCYRVYDYFELGVEVLELFLILNKVKGKGNLMLEKVVVLLGIEV